MSWIAHCSVCKKDIKDHSDLELYECRRKLGEKIRKMKSEWDAIDAVIQSRLPESYPKQVTILDGERRK